MKRFLDPCVLLTILALCTAPMLAQQSDDRGFLGVHLSHVENLHVGAEGNGVFVHRVLDGSGAEEAGLQQNDRIVAIGGSEVVTMEDVQRVLSNTRVDDVIDVTIERDGAPQDVSVTLGQLPQRSHGRWAMVLDDGGDRLGVRVMMLESQLAEYFGVPDGGLLVTKVLDESPAAEAGFRAGDVIVDVAGSEIRTKGDLHHALMETETGDRVRVEALRRGNPLTTFLEVGEARPHSARVDLEGDVTLDVHRRTLEAHGIEIVLPDNGEVGSVSLSGDATIDLHQLELHESGDHDDDD